MEQIRAQAHCLSYITSLRHASTEYQEQRFSLRSDITQHCRLSCLQHRIGRINRCVHQTTQRAFYDITTEILFHSGHLTAAICQRQVARSWTRSMQNQCSGFRTSYSSSSPLNVTMTELLKQESRAVARKLRDASRHSCSFRITSLRVAKLRKPGFKAPNIPVQNRIERKMAIQGHSRSRVLESVERQ